MINNNFGCLNYSNYYTTDGGNSWDNALTVPETAGWIRNLVCPFEGAFYFITGIDQFENAKYYLTRTSDWGKTWSIKENKIFSGFEYFDFPSLNKCRAIRNDWDPENRYKFLHNFLISNDTGNTWKSVQLNNVSTFKEIDRFDFYNDTYGIISGAGGLIYTTSDGGNSWTNEVPDFLGQYDDINDVKQVNDKIALAVTENKIMKRTDIDVHVDEKANDNNGLIISPNPATDFIEISYPSINHTLKGMVEGEIRIFNVFGEGVWKVLPSGEDLGGVIRLDISSLPPGVYFVRVGEKVGKFVKM